VIAAVGPFERLRFTRDEAEAIRALAGTSGVLALDFDASRETIAGGAVREAGIVHIAVHGMVDAHQPELSGLVLSLVDRTGKPRNGMLRLHDIYGLELDAELVVLSACQTALGKDVRGEGMVGLTRGFLHAGAPRVVASLWRVHDRGTAELMRRFYEGILRDEKPPVAALRDAQRSMLADPRWRAPYYWSAFVVQGDPGHSATRKR
jgi:CHAT domain-containing protein